jgi:hypothetical protein
MGISGLVATEDQVSIPARVEGKKNAIRPPEMLDPQFLQVGVLGTFESIHLRASESGTVLCKHVDRSVHAHPLLLIQRVVPLDKLVADFHFPSHDASIPSR